MYVLLVTDARVEARALVRRGISSHSLPRGLPAAGVSFAFRALMFLMFFVCLAAVCIVCVHSRLPPPTGYSVLGHDQNPLRYVYSAALPSYSVSAPLYSRGIVQ